MLFQPNKDFNYSGKSSNLDSVSTLKSKFKNNKSNILRFKIYDKNKKNKINVWNESFEKINLREIIYVLNVEKNKLNENSLIIKNFSENQFYDKNLLNQILLYKSEFDLIPNQLFQKSRSKSNLFELIYKNKFINRSAIKLANINYLFDNIFTKQKTFADVCAGPGGFTEYILKKSNYKTKGFGITLKNENDFKLNKILPNNLNCFKTHYGHNNSGNIYDPKIIDSFTNLILNETKIGVDFMMSDGGFSVNGQENKQEILSKRLYLCQCLLALKIVKVGGHCIIKFFDTFTNFTINLLYLMCKCFKKCQIVKLNSSRPANSERYLICLNKIDDISLICNHLYKVNLEMHSNLDEKFDIFNILDENLILNDQLFLNDINKMNNEIGKNQLNAMEKIMHCLQNPNINFYNKQVDIKDQSLKLWDLI